jgi:Saxitoxin biosynthesis operon protein SxtJ
VSSFVDLNLNPPRRTLRQFGFAALVGFGLLAFLAWREKGIFAFGLGAARQPVAVALIALGVLSALFALVFPKGNLPVFLALTLITFPIGFVMSYVIMGVLFFFVFGSVALMMRILRRDPLKRGYDRAAPTYWTDPPPGDRPRDSYFRQF